MSRFAILLVTAAVVFAAGDDPWVKVKELKSGTEIRVLKHGSMQPVLGKFGQADDDRLILVVKNEQVAIPKDQIDGLDYRPEQPRVVKQSSVKADDGTAPPGEPRQGMNGIDAPRPGYNSNAGLSIQGKGNFETLYRRQAPAPKK